MQYCASYQSYACGCTPSEFIRSNSDQKLVFANIVVEKHKSFGHVAHMFTNNCRQTQIAALVEDREFSCDPYTMPSMTCERVKSSQATRQRLLFKTLELFFFSFTSFRFLVQLGHGIDSASKLDEMLGDPFLDVDGNMTIALKRKECSERLERLCNAT